MTDVPHDLVEMDPLKAALMQEEINAVLAKYDAEIGVQSMIKVWYRKPKAVLSPIQPNEKENGNSDASTTKET